MANNYFHQAFGPHLVVDGYSRAPQKLVDHNLVYAFLDGMPDLIGMTKIMPPYIVSYPAPAGYPVGGLSGFVLIAESHISIHTYPENNFLLVDIFSCKNFNTDLAIAHIKGFFELEQYRSSLWDRGLEFPRETNLVAKYLEADRDRHLG
jgi:S-adenosylmethionine decarboxylase